MAKSWILPGGQGPVTITLRGLGGSPPAAGESEGDASHLAGRVAGWLRNSTLRPVVFAMFEAVSGRSLDPARTTDAVIQKTVRPTLERALQTGRLVTREGKGESESAREADEQPSWVLPSPSGKLKLGLGNKAGAETEHLQNPERLVDNWLSSA